MQRKLQTAISLTSLQAVKDCHKISFNGVASARPASTLSRPSARALLEKRISVNIVRVGGALKTHIITGISGLNLSRSFTKGINIQAVKPKR